MTIFCGLPVMVATLLHADCCWPEFPGFQPNEGARMVRYRAGLFHAATASSHHADDEQPADHGRQGQQPDNQRPGVGYYDRNLFHVFGAGGDLVYLGHHYARAHARQFELTFNEGVGNEGVGLHICRSYRAPGGMAKCACLWKIAILSG